MAAFYRLFVAARLAVAADNLATPDVVLAVAVDDAEFFAVYIVVVDASVVFVADTVGVADFVVGDDHQLRF